VLAILDRTRWIVWDDESISSRDRHIKVRVATQQRSEASNIPMASVLNCVDGPPSNDRRWDTFETKVADYTNVARYD
jgi:hypothetical protein